ncbi:MAG TPA: CHC2 zinc finger domain-containing protein, partial [Bdellovibrionota bacterium]|nr:CHC2 zinc finger domain-containing protein [Bdellovibrionota bacterium]
MNFLANRIPENVIEEIKQRSNIVEIVSRFVDLKRAGANFKGHCPFHSEKTPSFMVSEDKQIFHCFGCGVGGNIFTFLMKYEGKTFPEVLRELANLTGVSLPDQKTSQSGQDNRQATFRANKFAAKYFHQVLLGTQG